MTTSPASRLRTWSMFGDVRRKPTPYEAVTGKFHYHFRRDPVPFELDPEAPLNRWYLTHREGSPLQVEDWEEFRDPYKLTYRDYVSMQHDREVYLDALIDRHEADGTADGLSPEWVETLGVLFVPLRFPVHILQMVSLYVGQMAPSSYITNCAHFQAADEMRRVQRIAYWTKVLSNAHSPALAETAPTREIWESDARWQPLREALERLLTAYDWGEAFTALNVAVKPTFDALVNGALGELASANGDPVVAELCAEFARDSHRSQDWTQALTSYALEREPSLGGVLTGWLDTWRPRADAAVAGLGELFATAPSPLDAAQVAAQATAARDEFLVGTSI